MTALSQNEAVRGICVVTAYLPFELFMHDLRSAIIGALSGHGSSETSPNSLDSQLLDPLKQAYRAKFCWRWTTAQMLNGRCTQDLRSSLPIPSAILGKKAPNDGSFSNTTSGLNTGIYNKAGRGVNSLKPNSFLLMWQMALTSTSSSKAIWLKHMHIPSSSNLVFASRHGQSAAAGLWQRPSCFVNAVLYEHTEIFHDIKNGSNPGCRTEAFPALSGWDLSTGLGKGERPPRRGFLLMKVRLHASYFNPSPFLSIRQSTPDTACGMSLKEWQPHEAQRIIPIITYMCLSNLGLYQPRSLNPTYYGFAERDTALFEDEILTYPGATDTAIAILAT
ncbi:uncharacterized protein MYCFIDRAFT_174335 [Pseudocercospora fijiensis CIRAD86]|uniref:Uncharacterized protein n=1 Tax=Pseudocercospora fijiensis (strain CIRAD86) TaxID=383855 RepID=M3AE30_PSEFD|nr:uncharacterized protein MYCFIDRAFT_174335 [Pseudocercospora fijiensis CIRAD86]EME82796.1 hypothetical protein MYCFIDRAFT_174335 [Pseudocercospora fijiensis CIRAD86]